MLTDCKLVAIFRRAGIASSVRAGLLIAALSAAACGQTGDARPEQDNGHAAETAVRCELPGQIRTLGSGPGGPITYLARGAVIETTAEECRRRGGSVLSDDAVEGE